MTLQVAQEKERDADQAEVADSRDATAAPTSSAHLSPLISDA